jgi:adenylylsulfate kinase
MTELGPRRYISECANWGNRTSKILILGLPGAGKTTLAKVLAPKLAAVHFNADEVRAQINRDLGFSLNDRLEHARRMGWLCDQVALGGHNVIADFVCPTHEARLAFGEAFIVWVDRVKASAYRDTDLLFQPPAFYNLRVTSQGAPEYWANRVLESLSSPASDNWIK